HVLLLIGHVICVPALRRSVFQPTSSPIQRFGGLVSRRSSVTKESIPVGMAAELWLSCILQRRYIVGACHIEAIRAPKTRPSASTWWSCLRPCFLLSTGKDSKL